MASWIFGSLELGSEENPIQSMMYYNCLNASCLATITVIHNLQRGLHPGLELWKDDYIERL